MDLLNDFPSIIARHALTDGTFGCALPGVQLIRSSTPTLPMPVVYEPSVCFIAQGRKRAVLGNEVLHYDPASYLVASVALPVIGTVIEASAAAPYLCLQLDLDMVQLGEMALAHPSPEPDAAPPPIGLRLDVMPGDLLDAVTRLVRLLDADHDIAALAPLISREITYRLLTGPGGATLRMMAQADSRLAQVARAIRWLRDNYTQECRVEIAAETAGMSRSSFHQHFKAITAMSPLEFRTLLRMQEARRLMLTDGLDAARAGFAVGYESASQFSREYARMFGNPPGRDARRLRTVNA